MDNENEIIIERAPLRSALAAGLVILIPTMILALMASESFFIAGALIFSLLFPLLLLRNQSLQITSEGIRQCCFGQPLFLIRWNEIASVTYRDGFLGSRYNIKSKRSWLSMIDLPIDDESFPVIKKALAQQGLVLGKAELQKISS